jgi:hypothetical protein
MSSSESPRTKIIVSVSSTLIATTIIVGAARIWPSFAAWLGSAWTAAWGFITYRQPVPVWLLSFLILCAVALVAFILLRLRAIRPDWRSYTQDEFFGVIWRWRYTSQGGVADLIPFCPACDTLIRPARQDPPAGYYSSEWPYHTRFGCDHCTAKPSVTKGSIDTIHDKIIRQIDRKLRNDEWRQIAIRPSA